MKKLIKGRDYHGWAWKNRRTGEIGVSGRACGRGHQGDPCFTRHEPNGRKGQKVFSNGSWVRVKCVEVPNA
jgi:hypothetical protein